MEPTTQSKNGALIGSIIIIIILVLGGIYLVKTKVQNKNVEQNSPEQQAADAAANNLSNSDDVTDIEADLNANSVDSLNTDIQ